MKNKKRIKIELYNDNFQNYKRYGIPKAQYILRMTLQSLERRT